jgi:hypothetical protein
MKVIGSNSETVIRGYRNSDYPFDMDISPVVCIDALGQTSVDGEYLDLMRLKTVNQNSTYTSKVNIIKSAEDVCPTLNSENQEILTIDQQGNIGYVADGTTFVTASIYGIKRKVSVSVSRVIGSTQYSYPMFIENGPGLKQTLGYHISNEIDSRMVGVSFENRVAKQQLFSSKDNINGSSFSRNTSHWAADVDFSCFSPWNSYGRNNRAGTLISPRHILYANHYRFGAIQPSIVFVTSDNTIVTRQVIQEVNVAGTDIQIGILDSDVPETITYAKVLPKDWKTYLPSINNQCEILPIIVTNQDKNTLVYDVKAISNSLSGSWPKNETRMLLTQPEAANYYGGLVSAEYESSVLLGSGTNFTACFPSGFYVFQICGYGSLLKGTVISDVEMALANPVRANIANARFLTGDSGLRTGDSGSPSFFIVNGELVLSHCLHYGGFGGYGPFVSNYIDEINSAMNALGGTHQLTTINLSDFAVFN